MTNNNKRKTNILIFKQLDIKGIELAGYWQDQLNNNGCITAVVLSEYDNSVKSARLDLESFIMDCLNTEELKKFSGRIIYKGLKK